MTCFGMFVDLFGLLIVSSDLVILFRRTKLVSIRGTQ